MTANLLTLTTISFVHFLAAMSPGPSFLVTARTAVVQSRADGIKVALGLGAGTTAWSAAAILGPNFLFGQFRWLFTGMKVAGALFLLWIAYQIFWHAAAPVEMHEGASIENGHSPLVRGFLIQISSPKAVVFFGSIFVAMLPSEVPAWMIVALIAILTMNEIVWYSLVSLLFGIIASAPPLPHHQMLDRSCGGSVP
jgi:threonine/homoserine/homoserine lactone efflux protein